MGVAYGNLRLSRGALLIYLLTYSLTYLLTYLFIHSLYLSRHYDGDVDVMCNS